MAAKINDFLLEYYKRLIFNSMPIEQFVQYCDYVKKNDMAGNMKLWATELLQKDPRDNTKYMVNAGLYVPKDLPNPDDGDWELSDEEWGKLFRAFNNTFMAMDANKSKFKYNKNANDFLAKYFGPDKLFSYTTANPAADAKIAELGKVLKDHPEMKQVLKEFFNDDFSWRDLTDGISSKKYNTDPKFRRKLIDIAEAMEYDTKYNPQSPIKQMIGRALDFGAISSGFDDANINDARRLQLKLTYRELLNELYTKSKVFEVFQFNDSSKISKSLNDAKEFLDYNDTNSKSYVKPKRTDEITLPQRISKWWSDTYENYFEKYTKLRGDHIYFSSSAKLIFGAITKEKIKPTDGLDKILASADNIAKTIKSKSNTATNHFEWFSKTLGDLKATMPKAFAGALKNGRQMRAVISEIITTAVRNDKMDEAKTALEVLSVAHYGYTTSKIMDTFNKSDLTIFSDPGLSWNKSDGVKFVTNAMDKSIKFAFQTIGYGITIAGNAIRLGGRKFNGNSGRIAKARATLQSDRAEKKNKLSADLTEYKSALDSATNEQARRSRRGNTESHVKAAIDRYTNQIDSFDKSIQQQYQTIVNTVSTRQHNMSPSDIQNLQFWLDAVMNGTSPAPNLTVSDSVVQAAIERLKDIQTHRESVSKKLKRKETLRYEMINATESIRAYNDLIDKTQQAIDTFDDTQHQKFNELMAYWDFLESGKMDSHSPFSLSKKQGRADAIDPATGLTWKQIKFNKFKDAYSMSA